MASLALRALLDGCSTAGRSMRVLGGAGPPALLRLERGMKKSTRTVEICLLQDVEGLGRDGQVVPVKPGRARNFLVPEKFAAYASVERLAEAQHKQSFWVADSSAVVDVDELALKEARTSTNILTNSSLIVKRIAGKERRQDGPHLPCTAKVLVKEILRQRKLEVTEETLQMVNGPLSTFGTHTIPLWMDTSLVPDQLYLTVKVERKHIRIQTRTAAARKAAAKPIRAAAKLTRAATAHAAEARAAWEALNSKPAARRQQRQSKDARSKTRAAAAAKAADGQSGFVRPAHPIHRECGRSHNPLAPCYGGEFIPGTGKKESSQQ
mmetsp:Transcript_7903/g.19601  ORF Transcript_7903/g.19601 Transcript_7903/m.19601 type:complete len:323 (-) Transcript_7903:1171-2139(-)